MVKMLLKSPSFGRKDSMVSPLSPLGSNNIALEQSLSFKEWETKQNKLQKIVSFKMRDMSTDQYGSIVLSCGEGNQVSPVKSPKCGPNLLCRGSCLDTDTAATKLQKVYRGYRTRRNLADCAVVVEELWWKALDFASLKRSSVSFFHVRETESALSRWARALIRAAKVGKGLSKNDKAQKLALRHWLEAIDPRHRYGHNLHLYYQLWFSSESTQPFFFWLDIGEGKEVNLEKCPRYRLQHQCVQYLGPKEREAYEVVIRNGKLVYKKSDLLVHTTEDSKWIFVLSTARSLYVGKKEKGKFQHSSFLSGGATTAAGRLVVKCGILMAIWPYSGHYLPTKENFEEFISYLMENDVDLNHVKRGSVSDEDVLSTTYKGVVVDSPSNKLGVANCSRVWIDSSTKAATYMHNENTEGISPAVLVQSPQCRWTTGAGARIGCVRDYHVDLQSMALEQVNLSPRFLSSSENRVPIPSPRPNSGLMLSPGIASYMGVPNPTLSPTFGKMVISIPTVSLDLPPLKKRASQKVL